MSDAAYSPRLRTAVVLCGTGTAGAYHAGVLRALVEAGVKVDLVAGHGVGVVTALAAAADGGPRLWDSSGVWSEPALARAYRWRPALRGAAAAFALAGIALVAPLLVLVAATALWAAGTLAALANLPSVAEALVGVYPRALALLFDPPVLPTVVPRTVVLAVLIGVFVLAGAAWRAWRDERSRRRVTGAFWWRLVGSPLHGREPAATLIEALWRLVRGASEAPRPRPADIGRRYVELVEENLGQPQFREVLVGVHDLDARRDLVGAVVDRGWRDALLARRPGAGAREAEVLDLTGSDGGLVVDVVEGALRLPVASPPHPVEFPADGYWKGERHRFCDRPELAVRLLDEVARVGVEQVILTGPAPPPGGPHALRGRPLDLRGRMGEVVRSMESAVLQDAAVTAAARFSASFVIRPDHNPVGPFDFAGAWDEASDRHRAVTDLIDQGYADAYRQFIDPVVASGERVEDI